MIPVERRLRRALPEQAERHERLAGAFAARHDAIRGLMVDAYATPPWRGFLKELESQLLPRPPFDFLRLPVILHTMHVMAGGDYMRRQVAELEQAYPRERLRAWLREDPEGRPVVLDRTYETSHNRIVHLYHLMRFERATGRSLASHRRIVEWGGGYGNLARLVRRMAPGGTYVLIDTPLFATLQWLYLSSVLGEDEVRLLPVDRATVEEGKLNVVPVGAIPADLRADAFVSTWALSESSDEAQEAVLRANWYGAESLLLGYQQADPAFPAARRLEARLAAMPGVRLESFPFVEHAAYAFRPAK